MASTKSVQTTASQKEAARRIKLNYSKIYYIEMQDKGNLCTSILGPQGFKTWIQCYRYLINFMKRHEIDLKSIPKLESNVWAMGSVRVEIKWMKVI